MTFVVFKRVQRERENIISPKFPVNLYVEYYSKCSKITKNDFKTKVVSKGRSSVSIEGEGLYIKYVCHLVNYKSLQVRDMHFHLMVIDCRN